MVCILLRLIQLQSAGTNGNLLQKLGGKIANGIKNKVLSVPSLWYIYILNYQLALFLLTDQCTNFYFVKSFKIALK